MNCPICLQDLNKHRTLELWWCVNPRCQAFDRPQMVNRDGLGGRSEKAAPSTALPSATSLGVDGEEHGR
jgi:hypothetical protein